MDSILLVSLALAAVVWTALVLATKAVEWLMSQMVKGITWRHQGWKRDNS